MTPASLFGALRRQLARLPRIAGRGFPFLLGPRRTAILRLRALGFSFRSPGNAPLKEYLAYFIRIPGWPVVAFSGSWQVARPLSLALGTSAPAAFFHAFRQALLRNVPPSQYLRYARVHHDVRNRLSLYLFPLDTPALLALNARRGANNAHVQDKHRFAEICSKHSLPHPATLAVFKNGRDLLGASAIISTVDRFFVKDLAGNAGAGTDRWTREERHFRNLSDELVPAEQLTSRLTRHNCIVQPCLTNHPDVRRLSEGALASLRIVTGIDGKGMPHLIYANLYLPLAQRVGTNHGVLCAISLASGTVTAAIYLREKRRVAACPGSDEPLEGFALPFWRDSTDLVLRAHATAFPRFVTLGWDVALTPQGPLLLEANSGWGSSYQQVLCGPLGETALSGIIDDHLPA